MSFKGSNIVDTMMVRDIVTEIICDVIVENAGYMHYVRTKGLPLLLKALETGGPKKEIRKMFNNIDAKMNFLFCLFERHRHFLAPLKLMQNI